MKEKRSRYVSVSRQEVTHKFTNLNTHLLFNQTLDIWNLGNSLHYKNCTSLKLTHTSYEHETSTGDDMQDYLIGTRHSLARNVISDMLIIAEVKVPRRFYSPERFVLCGSGRISGGPVLLEGKMGFLNEGVHGPGPCCNLTKF